MQQRWDGREKAQHHTVQLVSSDGNLAAPPTGSPIPVAYSDSTPAANQRHSHWFNQEHAMLHYAIVFIVIALIAAVFGFGGIASSAAGIAQILFVLFLILAVGAFFFGRNK